ncbi:CoA-transferase subunit beta [Enemella sp. A6]|uniref:CoA-transferase subunit beta n=1 Tax=Enemella sp. A6 TaxID=3440152 RepID=UPI003EB93135
MSNETATQTVTRAEYCVVACAEAFRDNGEILASAFGTIPAIGARLARETFSPDLLLTDGEANTVRGTWAVGTSPEGPIEGWTPFRRIFDLVWNGKRHVMMIPSQIDAAGNMNISVIGDFQKPKAALIGVRGGPGNTISHPTSYWVPKHGTRVFVEKVDMIAGVGYDSAEAAGKAASEFLDLRAVVTNLCVFHFVDGRMQVKSLHPGVTAEEVEEATGFAIEVPADVPTTREPTEEELRLIREVIDPRSLRDREVPNT